MLILVIFFSIFIIAALLIAATGTGASEREKHNQARLEALLAVKGATKEEEELIDIEKRELLSSIPLLNRFLLGLEIAPKLRRVLYQANVKWTPGGFLLMSFALWMLGTYAFYLRTNQAFFSLLVGLIPACGPLLYVARMRAGRLLKFQEGLPPALDLMVSGLRGGHSISSVLELVSREARDPIGPEFRICFEEQNYGVELRTALENLAIRVPLQDVRMMIVAILVQRETGGNLAEVLEKCAFVIRERFRLQREIRTKTAQGRLTGWVLSIMPIFLGVMLYIIRPDVISLLWTRPAGVKMLYVGVVMIVIGSLIIRKIVRIRV